MCPMVAIEAKYWEQFRSKITGEDDKKASGEVRVKANISRCKGEGNEPNGR